MELSLIHSSTKAAVQHAQDVRGAHRKRSARGSLSRETDITLALDRLKRVMRPIRSELARLPYLIREADPDEAEVYREVQEVLRLMSNDIQRERRKLWKMQQRKGGRRARKR